MGTLVELVSSVPVSVPLYTASDGSFTFTNVPAGDYTLWIWWTPGFVEGAANVGTTVQPDLLQVRFTVNADGTVTGPAALQVLLKPLPEGLIPFPVKTGPGGGPVPVGVVDVGQALGERPAALPPTGGGPRDDADSLLRWLGAGVLALAVLSGLTVARHRARA